MFGSSRSNEQIAQILNSDLIYFYSLKHQRVLQASDDDFKTEQNCELCIAKYNAMKKTIPCQMKFKKFSRFKNHLLICESNYKRQLVWLNIIEIPPNLQREREIGDLRILERESILKIEFNSQTFVDFKWKLLEHFRKFGCPCKDELNGFKCEIKTVGLSLNHLFSHLSSLERKNSKYMVFKGIPNEISRIEDNHNFNLRYLSDRNDMGKNLKNYSRIRNDVIVVSPISSPSTISLSSSQNSENKNNSPHPSIDVNQFLDIIFDVEEGEQGSLNQFSSYDLDSFNDSESKSDTDFEYLFKDQQKSETNLQYTRNDFIYMTKRVKTLSNDNLSIKTNNSYPVRSIIWDDNLSVDEEIELHSLSDV